MVTYPGLDAPVICDFWSRASSREHYEEGTEFQIGRINMVANTGTYVDSPFHRYAHGKDLAELPLTAVAELDGVVIRIPTATGRAIERIHFEGIPVRGRAVLVHTGWSRHWGTDAYFSGHPFLTEDAAVFLRDAGVALVGIDSLNIDDTSGRTRPVHTVLLGADIPVCEHMAALDAVPDQGFRFHAVPVKVKGMGTFPVRAYAVVEVET